MTKDQQLEAIRAACIRVNPEGFDCGSPCHCSGGRLIVRLADVLLALGNKQYEVSLGGCLAVFFKPGTGIGLFAWRIHKDDLAQQSVECVAFLANSLG